MILRRPLIVLDDDPTGAQAVTGVPMLLDWGADALEWAAQTEAPALHLLTNTRAYPPERAYEIVREAAEAAVSALPEARLLLRGDSTLRAHLLEEYQALRDVAFPGREPVLMLVPALPAAGRITVGGVHLLARDGQRVPLHETEYARDPAFAYSDARLLRWAEDRSHGYFPAAAGREVPLDALRSQGADAVREALLALHEAPGAAVCGPDAETVEDLRLIAQGLDAAEAQRAEVIVRSAPTFVGALAGNLATQHVPAPRAPGGVFVVCGSYVPLATRQLERLIASHPGALVEVDLDALAGSRPEPEIERCAQLAQKLLDGRRLAVVATPRDHVDVGLEAGERLAVNVAGILSRLDPQPDVVVAKGGITSAITVRAGLGTTRAWVVGPIVDGVALWRVRSAEGAEVPFVVFPGNVGGDETLADVVSMILDA